MSASAHQLRRQADVERLQLLSQVLGGSRSSRLDKRLVFQDKLADSVSTAAWSSLLGGLFSFKLNLLSSFFGRSSCYTPAPSPCQPAPSPCQPAPTTCQPAPKPGGC